MDNIQKRIKELREKINFHAYQYYNLNESDISDFEYDMLLVELKDLERKYPEYITADSPTQLVQRRSRL